MRPVVRFLASVGLLDLLALVLAAWVAPPDPLTQAVTVGPMLVAAPVVAYWLVYVRAPTDDGTDDGSERQ